MDTKEATAQPGKEATIPTDASPAAAQAGEKPEAGPAAKTAAAGAAYAKGFAKAGVAGLSRFGGQVFANVLAPVKALLGLPLLILQGSLASRLISLGFAASVLLVLITGYKLTKRFVPASWFSSGKTETASSFNKYLEQQKEYAIASASVIFLERYTTTVTSAAGKVRYLEVEFYAECDQPETCRVLKTRMVDVREVLTTATQGRSYDTLITEPGKEAFRQDVLKALNERLKKWKMSGSIRRVFITSFVMA